MWPSVPLVLLTTFMSITTGYQWTETSTRFLESESHHLPSPYFEETPSIVETSVGQTAYIPCRVHNLGDKIVSWIRSRDLHILTSAGFMFTADSRFSLIHPEDDSAAWTLQLQNSQVQDGGLYECQVNTEPKIKQAVLLTVSDRGMGIGMEDVMELAMKDDPSAVGKAHILGPREQYIRSGSTWTLTCEITGLPTIRASKTGSFLAKPTRLVDWMHEGQLLTYQSTRGGVSIDTEHGEGETVSRLTLANLRNEDTGRYVCKPLSLPPAVVTIIVIEGEKTSMLGRNVAVVTSSYPFLVAFLSLLLLQ